MFIKREKLLFIVNNCNYFHWKVDLSSFLVLSEMETIIQAFELKGIAF